MKKRTLFSGLAIAASTLVVLSSCGESRNSKTPTGNINMDTVVATASFNSNTYELKNNVYYNKLRYSASDLITKKIKEGLYSKELTAIKELWTKQNLSDVSAESQALLTPTKNNVKLFELANKDLDDTKTNYEYLYDNLETYVNNQLASYILGSSSYKSIKSLTDKDKETKITTFITTQSRSGYEIKKEDIVYTVDEDKDTIKFTNLHSSTNSLASYIDQFLLTQAELLSSKNALYQIIDEEYTKAYNADEDDEETKNSNYYFVENDDASKETNYVTNYNSSYKTYGTYHAIVIQFNSRKEALDTMARAGVSFTGQETDDEKLAKYVALYNAYYNYRGSNKTVADKYCDDFTFKVNKDENGLSKLSESAKNVITTVLEDGDCLTEPRNSSSKYIMAYRYDSTYDYAKANDETEQAEWEDIKKQNVELYNKLKTRIKYTILDNNTASYTTTNLNSMIYTRTNSEATEDDIYIFDALFEQKFASSYTDFEFMDSKYYDMYNPNNDTIIKIDDYTYTVDEFYNDASKLYSSTIITNQFQLDYAYLYYDEYVENLSIDDEAHDNNVETLNNAISTFNSGNNASYPKEIGLENFLLANYGYADKESVIKYYYDASAALSVYKAKTVYTEWAVKQDDGSYKLKDTDGDGTADIMTSGVLKNILDAGNSDYSDIMSISLDHLLINIDDDGDGSADDPDEFTKDMTDEQKTKFENAVVELARAIYAEVESDAFKNTTDSTKKYKDTIYNILTYIKKQYEQGANLHTTVTIDGETFTNWDAIRNHLGYNFLLTVEQLSSSSNITQSSVTNYVKPFQEYVKGIYKTAKDLSLTTSYTNGRFYYYNADTKQGNLVSTSNDINTNTLCKTVFGYHVLVLNSYSNPSSLSFTSKDDSTSAQSAIELLLYKNSDDSTKNIYVTSNTYNDNSSAASFNQLLVYYIQSRNGDTSSLDSTISSMMSTLFDTYISAYVSSDFQTLLLIDHMNIEVKLDTVKSAVAIERDYYAKVVTSYAASADDSDLYYWVYQDDAHVLDFSRPDAK